VLGSRLQLVVAMEMPLQVAHTRQREASVTPSDTLNPLVRRRIWKVAITGSKRVLRTPLGPGFGMKLNEDVIREHPQQRIFFNLFAQNWHLRQAVPVSPAEGSQPSH
jgi:hypothetical protein